VTAVKHYDGTGDEFVYNKKGELLEARNEDVILKFERDATGRIIKEMQNDYVIESTYDELGNRTFVESSLGARTAMSRNNMGQITHLASAQAGKEAWGSTTTYNELGLEELRQVSGGMISERSYDVIGRVRNHRVRSGSRDTRKKTYEWNTNHRLKKVTDELTKTTTIFSYDRLNNLVKAEYDYDNILYRKADKVNNYYKTKDRSDRIYGKGSRLEKSEVNTRQVAHETFYGVRTLEYGGINPIGCFNSKYHPTTSAGINLGNLYENDGSRFQGAGYLQITGRWNCTAFLNYIGNPNIVDQGYELVGSTYTIDIAFVPSPGDISIGPYAAWEASGWF